MGNTYCSCKETVSDAKNEVDASRQEPQLAYPGKDPITGISQLLPDATNSIGDLKGSGSCDKPQINGSPSPNKDEAADKCIATSKGANGNSSVASYEENRRSTGSVKHNGANKKESPCPVRPQRAKDLEVDVENIEKHSRITNEEKVEDSAVNVIEAVEEAEIKRISKLSAPHAESPSIKFVDSVPINRILHITTITN